MITIMLKVKINLSQLYIRDGKSIHQSSRKPKQRGKEYKSAAIIRVYTMLAMYVIGEFVVPASLLCEVQFKTVFLAASS